MLYSHFLQIVTFLPGGKKEAHKERGKLTRPRMPRSYKTHKVLPQNEAVNNYLEETIHKAAHNICMELQGCSLMHGAPGL